MLCIARGKSNFEARRTLDFSAWRELPYSLFTVAIFLGFVGFYVPFCYVQAYSMEAAFMGRGLAFYLSSILNAGAFCGRIVSEAHPDHEDSWEGPMADFFV